MSNLIQLPFRQASQAAREETSVLDATQRLNDLVLQLNEVARHFMASTASASLKRKVVQNIVGMQRHAHCISKDITCEYRLKSGHRKEWGEVLVLASPEIAVMSRE